MSATAVPGSGALIWPLEGCQQNSPNPGGENKGARLLRDRNSWWVKSCPRINPKTISDLDWNWLAVDKTNLWWHGWEDVFWRLPCLTCFHPAFLLSGCCRCCTTPALSGRLLPLPSSTPSYSTVLKVWTSAERWRLVLNHCPSVWLKNSILGRYNCVPVIQTWNGNAAIALLKESFLFKWKK